MRSDANDFFRLFGLRGGSLSLKMAKKKINRKQSICFSSSAMSSIELLAQLTINYTLQ